MSYRVRDTTPPAKPVERITDEDLHPLIDSEIQRVPSVMGVYILYDGSGPIAVTWGELLGQALMARTAHPKATRFSLRFCDNVLDAMQIADVLRKELGLISKEPIGFSRPA
jgi:hypothetical protein